MDVDTAQGLELGIAQELTGLTLQLTASLTVTVAGQVVDERGQPARNVPNVSLVRDGATDHLSSNFSEPVGADGRFVVSRVAPGRYIAYAAETGAAGQTPFATSEVYVAGDDLEGLRLMVTPGASARGRIFFDCQNQPDFSHDSIQPFTMPRGHTPVPVGRGIATSMTTGRSKSEGSPAGSLCA